MAVNVRGSAGGLTVAVPNWNHELLLPRSVGSALRGVAALRAAGVPAEVLVIDENGEKLGAMPHGFTEYKASRFGPVIEETVGKLVHEYAAGEDQEEAAKAVEAYAAARKGKVQSSRTAAKTPDA